MAELILLKREFVQDLNETTTQWREYLFNTGDPDGPIFLNLVINSTVFDLAGGALVWTNPDTGDEYFYVAPGAVSKTAGTGPVIPPPLPDLSDPYGLRFLHEFTDWKGDTVRFEIYKRAYVGATDEVDGAGQNLNVSWENEGKIFTSFRGSRADLTLHSDEAVSSTSYSKVMKETTTVDW